MGFGFIQQVQAACDECGGDGWNLFIYYLHLTGEFIEEKDRCANCEGEKTLEDEKTLDVYIDKGNSQYSSSHRIPGMEHGQKLTFSGEADQLPGTVPGNFIS